MTNAMNSPRNPYGSDPADRTGFGTGSTTGSNSQTSDSAFNQQFSAQSINKNIKTIWATRPVRLPREQNSDAWAFGVAEGIAVRYQVSPLLVRLFFVLLALSGGGGLLLYGLCAVLMPRYSVPLSPFEVVLNNSTDPRYKKEKEWAGALLVLLVLIIASSGWLTEGWGLAGLVIGGLALWLLHQRMPIPPAILQEHPYSEDPFSTAGGRSPSETTNSSAAKGTDSPQHPFTPVEGFATQPSTPPSWDPLGTAPFAWDLPDPDEVLGTENAKSGSATALRTKKSSLFKKAVLGLIALLCTGLLALTAIVGLGLAVGNNDSSSATVGNTDSVVLKNTEQAQTVISLSSSTVSLSDLEIRSDSQQDLKIYASAVELRIPTSTNGSTYRLKLNCDNTLSSSTGCEAAQDVVVKGTDWGPELEKKRTSLPTLNLNASSVLSSLKVVRE